MRANAPHFRKLLFQMDCWSVSLLTSHRRKYHRNTFEHPSWIGVENYAPPRPESSVPPSSAQKNRDADTRPLPEPPRRGTLEQHKADVPLRGRGPSTASKVQEPCS